MTRLVLASLVVMAACSSGQKDGSGVRDAEFYYSLAVNSYYEKRAQEALQELDTCFSLDPNHARAHNLAGLIYMGRKEYADSLTHFRRAIEADPTLLDAVANLGALYVAMESWQEAIDTLTPLLRNPTFSTPYLAENNVGWSYYNLGELSQAEAHLKRAILLNDALCLAWNNVGVVHAAQKRYEDALDDFDAAVKRCPEYVEPHYRAGAVLETLAKTDEARQRYTRCVKLGGDSLVAKRCRKRLEGMQ